ncbi:hypothetical protein PIB30_025998 [Stylosanthes scabra]|uniref:Uncharacterized protein n=1 Tax=Stylosanthes scabra TaxID=79078 RepID=A0ABU6U918_9FABA|nr:hypothetical protein [Stylosanthes scabra]
MEDLSMFQRPRTVALEDENPGTYGRIRESQINLVATPPAERSSKWRRCRGVKHARRSNPNPDLLDLDLELERTLRRARQVRRRIQFENSLYSRTENLATDEISVDSSLSDSKSEKFFSPTHAGTLNMAEPPRITLSQMGEASVALENQPVRYHELNENFELNTGLINLLPRFHGIPPQMPLIRSDLCKCTESYK